jgi:hypothetical protein
MSPLSTRVVASLNLAPTPLQDETTSVTPAQLRQLPRHRKSPHALETTWIAVLEHLPGWTGPDIMPKDLLSDDCSDSDDGGAQLDSSDFKVNQDFARKFEYNKKREEKQRRMYMSYDLTLLTTDR